MCFLLTLADTEDPPDNNPEITYLKETYRQCKQALLEFGGLEPYKEGGRTHGYLVGVTGMPAAEEAFCSIDPFAYLSHLSAMAWHGLTDRLPNTLFFTHPSAGLRKRLSDKRLQSALKAFFPLYQQARFPGYQRVAIRKLNKRPLNIWSSSRLDDTYQAAYKKASDGRIRVATVGRCFLDMVREPVLCGGIYHVIEVFEEHGANHAEQILTELDHHGNRVEQARAGYLLERADPELTSHPTLQRWTASVTRGGSRKLDPTSDYSDRFSERWALSINV